MCRVRNGTRFLRLVANSVRTTESGAESLVTETFNTLVHRYGTNMQLVEISPTSVEIFLLREDTPSRVSWFEPDSQRGLWRWFHDANLEGRHECWHPSLYCR